VCYSVASVHDILGCRLIEGHNKEFVYLKQLDKKKVRDRFASFLDPSSNFGLYDASSGHKSGALLEDS